MKKTLKLFAILGLGILLCQNTFAQDKKIKEGTGVGDRCMEIVQDDPNGNEVRLSTVLPKNEYVLVDFWASWCGPCMREMPYLLAAKAKYGEKGFEIFGVSLDFRKEAWTETIDKYELDWIHVSDLEYWQNKAAVKFGVRSIPTNYLVDKNGVIVDKNLRGTALMDKLATLLD